MEKEAEKRRQEEANNPDVLFKWLCKFCGRTNKRTDLRCRGCDTKKPLKVVRAEAAFLEKRREEKENENMMIMMIMLILMKQMKILRRKEYEDK